MGALAPDELRPCVGHLVGRVPAPGLQPPSGVLEPLEELSERVQVDDPRVARHVFGPPVHDQFTRYDDGHLTLTHVPELRDLLGIGERRPVNDDLATVRVLVHGRATALAATGAVEAQSPHDHAPLAGCGSRRAFGSALRHLLLVGYAFRAAP